MQRLTRLASKLGRPICSVLPSWRSELASLQLIPCEALTPRTEQRRCGHVGDEKWEQDVTLLDPLLGKWVEIRKENYNRYLTAAGVATIMHDLVIDVKKEMTFRRNGADWEVEFGDLDRPHRTLYSFQFGEEFEYISFTGRPMKSFYYQDGKTLRERHESQAGPKLVIVVVNEVKDNQLVVTSSIAGHAGKAIFERAL